MTYVIDTPDPEYYNSLTPTQRFNSLIRGLREVWKVSDCDARNAILFVLADEFRYGRYLDMLAPDDVAESVEHAPNRHLTLVK